MSFACDWTGKQTARLNRSLFDLSEERRVSPPLQTRERKPQRSRIGRSRQHPRFSLLSTGLLSFWLGNELLRFIWLTLNIFTLHKRGVFVPRCRDDTRPRATLVHNQITQHALQMLGYAGRSTAPSHPDLLSSTVAALGSRIQPARNTDFMHVRASPLVWIYSPTFTL